MRATADPVLKEDDEQGEQQEGERRIETKVSTAHEPERPEAQQHRDGVHRFDERQAAQAVEPIDDDLIAPLKSDPCALGIDGAEDVSPRDGSGFQDRSPGSDMPEDIDVPYGSADIDTQEREEPSEAKRLRG